MWTSRRKQSLKHWITSLACTAALLGSLAAQAAPVEVSVAVSGSANNWVLDFSVSNNMAPASPDMAIYFFGVHLGARDIDGSPAGFDPNSHTSWSNTWYGGSSTVYDNVWIDGSFGNLLPGQSLSGFKAGSSAFAAPTDIRWFAYAYGRQGGTYTGGGNFNNDWNPGFEGVARSAAAAVPEPTSLALSALALAGLGLRRRRQVA